MYKSWRLVRSNDNLIIEYMKVILKILIFVTYLLMEIKCWSLDNDYIVKMMILYLGWTVVRDLMFENIYNVKRIKVRFNTIIYWRYHRNIKLYYLYLVFGICFIVQWLIDCCFYYYVDRSKYRSIIMWLFKNLDCVRQRLTIL